MQKLSKFYYFFLSFILFALLTTYHLLHTTIVDAQDPIPKLLLPCDGTDNNEFHSLRPYQAAPCGGSPQALFCSNKLVVFESIDLAFKCQSYREWETGTRYCEPNYHVKAHDLNITLDESEFPIMGNTQDDFDDAQKVNEYASWYLSGVNDKRENKEATNEQVVNFSGPVKKLLPSMIQDAQRIKIINSPITMGAQAGKSPPPALEVDDDLSNQPDNHDQFVVDNERLTDWLKDLSFLRLGALAWDKRYPPLPWSDQNGKPFKSQVLYRKAYNEWLGKSCAIVPIFGLVCVDIKLGPIDIITNKYADLWHFVPLSNNSDKKGKNYLLTGDGPSYVPSKRTEIDNAQHKSYKNAPLYFAHTQEVKDLSELLNQTYWPADYESEPLPETTEKIKKGIKEIPTNPVPNPVPVPPTGNSSTGSVPAPAPAPVPPSRDPYANLDCSAVNVRVNEGDNLFPGDRPDNKELYVEGAEYDITGVECDEVYEVKPKTCEDEKTGLPYRCDEIEDSFVCTALVGIEFKLGTQTPFANEIFSDTVADSGSTFRKIFPKVEKGAPVECIADIPTTTNVTYKLDPDLTQVPAGITQDFVQKAYPADGAGDGTQLTFPHIGSVYEYFLKGIQTALRPKGYGEPIANGNCKPAEEEPEIGTCKQWLLDENVYNKVIAKAAATKCNGKSLNPFWAIGIGLNENGGLMTDMADGSSGSHFGCNVSQVQSIDEKIDCMVNTLRKDCVDGKTDEATLQEYGYPPGYVLWPITVLDPSGTYPPPLFGSGFNVSQLITNLNNADWRATYASQAQIFCPNSPSFPY